MGCIGCVNLCVGSVETRKYARASVTMAMYRGVEIRKCSYAHKDTRGRWVAQAYKLPFDDKYIEEFFIHATTLDELKKVIDGWKR